MAYRTSKTKTGTKRKSSGYRTVAKRVSYQGNTKFGGVTLVNEFGMTHSRSYTYDNANAPPLRVNDTVWNVPHPTAVIHFEPRTPSIVEDHRGGHPTTITPSNKPIVTITANDRAASRAYNNAQAAKGPFTNWTQADFDMEAGDPAVPTKRQQLSGSGSGARESKGWSALAHAGKAAGYSVAAAAANRIKFKRVAGILASKASEEVVEGLEDGAEEVADKLNVDVSSVLAGVKDTKSFYDDYTKREVERTNNSLNTAPPPKAKASASKARQKLQASKPAPLTKQRQQELRAIIKRAQEATARDITERKSHKVKIARKGATIDKRRAVEAPG